MNIPQFPKSREITLDDKPLFDSIFAADPPEISAYTFTNIFAWRIPYHSAVSRIGDAVLISHNWNGTRVLTEPLGTADPKAAIIEAFRLADGEISFERIHAKVAAMLAEDQHYLVESDRDNFDYLYLTSDLIKLPGRKYDGKRNHVARFKSQTRYEYERLSQSDVEDCHRFAEYWCEQRKCRTEEGLHREHCAVYEMLSNFDNLGIVGGAIKVDGAVIAFALGEALNPETFVVHVEKADSQVEGIYQFINNEFCTHEAQNFEYVNREQDMGVPGLRKAKKSYHPARLVETFRVSLR